MGISVVAAGIGSGSTGTGGGTVSAKGALSHTVLTVTDTAQIFTGSTNITSIIVQNNGTAIAYLGGSGVTTTSFSIQISPRQAFDFGAVNSSFSFRYICATTQTTTLGISKYA